MKRRIIKSAIFLVLSAVMIVAAYRANKAYWELERADNMYEELRDKYVDTVGVSKVPTPDTTIMETPTVPTESVPATPSEDNGEGEPDMPDIEENPDVGQEVVPTPDTDIPSQEQGGESEEGEDIAEKTDEIPSECPSDAPVYEPVKIKVNFDALLADNADVVGWIYCEGTPIHYPVVQAADNETYLHADINGKYLASGMIFGDYRNAKLGSDKNFIIYGHNMKNQSMFGSLKNYKKQSYYDAHPTLSYLTPDGNYTIVLIAGAVVDKRDIIYYQNPDSEKLQTYLDAFLKKSTFQSGLTFTPNDKLVTLSTCTYDFEGARYVLIGKLVPCG